MTAARATNVTIVDADLSRAEHQKALVTMLDALHARSEDGGSRCRSKPSAELMPGLRAHPACYVLLAYRDGRRSAFRSASWDFRPSRRAR